MTDQDKINQSDPFTGSDEFYKKMSSVLKNNCISDAHDDTEENTEELPPSPARKEEDQKLETPEQRTEEDMETVIDSPASSTDEEENPYKDFENMNKNPNEGMVIVQMDNGGPRMKRRCPTEIVIPLDHVTSEESVDSSYVDSEQSDAIIRSRSLDSQGYERLSIDSEKEVESVVASITETPSNISVQQTKNSDMFASTDVQFEKLHGQSYMERANLRKVFKPKPDTPADDCFRKTTSPKDINYEPSFHVRTPDFENTEEPSHTEYIRCEDNVVTAVSAYESNNEIEKEEVSSDKENVDSRNSSRHSRESNCSQYSRSSNTTSSDITSRIETDIVRSNFLQRANRLKSARARNISVPNDKAITTNTDASYASSRATVSPFVSRQSAFKRFPAFSANNRFRNIGYVRFDSPAPLRPTSTCIPPLSVGLSPPIGDTVKEDHANPPSVIDAPTPFENDASSPICSTRFDFTPAAQSKIEGTVTVCLGAGSGARSLDSGRKNPQAKEDSEIRSDKPVVNSLQKWGASLVLPPIPKGKSILNGRERQSNNVTTRGTRQILTKTLTSPVAQLTKPQIKMVTNMFDLHVRGASVKPGIPHQLRSVACYQDGKVNVSITGDHRLMAQPEPLNVNLTFVHRQNPPPNKESALKDVAFGETKDSRHKSLVPPNSARMNKMPANERGRVNLIYGAKRPLPPVNSKLEHKHKTDITKIRTTKEKDLVVTNKFTSHKTLPPLKNAPKGSGQKQPAPMKKKGKKKQSKKYSPLRWDVVNARAQWPPFNTHTDPEASERHQKLLTDLAV